MSDSQTLVTRLTDDQWRNLTTDALTDLGGGDLMVVGAQLRQRMVALGYERGMDVAQHVAATGLSFTQLLHKVPNVVVRRRPGSDTLVGTGSAREPDWQSKTPARPRGALRRDVYQAFTRVGPVPYVYEAHSDRFVPENQSQGPTIAVQSVKVDVLKDDRMQFAHGLPDEHRDDLVESLEHSVNPLGDFRRTIERHGLLDQWGTAQARIVWSRVLRWAQEAEVTPRDSWFQEQRSQDSPHRTLSTLVPYLTASEIRDLKIPFRAIEAFLSDRK